MRQSSHEQQRGSSSSAWRIAAAAQSAAAGRCCKMAPGWNCLFSQIRLVDGIHGGDTSSSSGQTTKEKSIRRCFPGAHLRHFGGPALPGHRLGAYILCWLCTSTSASTQRRPNRFALRCHLATTTHNHSRRLRRMSPGERCQPLAARVDRLPSPVPPSDRIDCSGRPSQHPIAPANIGTVQHHPAQLAHRSVVR